ncbi:MAG: hypothetical protein LBE91_15275 [Tannerella sp.]|jgi:hypothetical protein|nr:hypothetical protein [Tannerella sp.]
MLQFRNLDGMNSRSLTSKGRFLRKALLGTSLFMLSSLILLFVSSCFNSSGGSSNSNRESADKAKSWQVVYSFSGVGEKKSPVFELTGTTSRFKYDYTADNEYGGGVFGVFVVNTMDESDGLVEVMVDTYSEKSESALYREKGKYYFHVVAVGKWTVTVEEFK